MSNASVIKSGHKKFVAAIEKQILLIAYDYAKYALKYAVKDWDSVARGRMNLTGNTRNGFVAAVFWNGSLAKTQGNNPLTVDDIEGWNVKDVTSTTTRPGRGGFKDYSSGEEVDSVRNYNKGSGLSFQTQGTGSFSKELSLQFISGYRPIVSNGATIVLANCTPYGEYLLEVRKLDILDNQSNRSVVNQSIQDSIQKFAKQLEK